MGLSLYQSHKDHCLALPGSTLCAQLERWLLRIGTKTFGLVYSESSVIEIIFRNQDRNIGPFPHHVSCRVMKINVKSWTRKSGLVFLEARIVRICDWKLGLVHDGLPVKETIVRSWDTNILLWPTVQWCTLVVLPWRSLLGAGKETLGFYLRFALLSWRSLLWVGIEASGMVYNWGHSQRYHFQQLGQKHQDFTTLSGR